MHGDDVALRQLGGRAADCTRAVDHRSRCEFRDELVDIALGCGDEVDRAIGVWPGGSTDRYVIQIQVAEAIANMLA
jgi:hypothetical protein